eukprot:1143597-Pelagomonas_calceolata.AAC.6
MYSSMLARIATKYRVQQPEPLLRINRRVCCSNKAYMCAYPKLGIFSPNTVFTSRVAVFPI